MVKYAIIETGGKQYKVKEGDIIDVEHLGVAVGSEVSFERVLLLANNGDLKIGTPYVEKAKVKAKVIEEGKAKKVIVFKYRRRKSSKKMRGHRQLYSRLRIEKIEEV